MLKHPFAWFELNGRNAAAVDFYKKALGWDVEVQEMEGVGSFPIFKMPGDEMGFAHFFNMDHAEDGMMDGVPAHWALYVYVDDVDASAVSVVEAGGEVKVPAMDLPGVGRMAMCTDPGGAAFWLFHPESA
ncbi:MAG: VOC family protein [Fimbriimonadaceae bacterium]|nr:VOC family protein [Fimbriimonadaceae bacterium]